MIISSLTRSDIQWNIRRAGKTWQRTAQLLQTSDLARAEVATTRRAEAVLVIFPSTSDANLNWVPPNTSTHQF